MHHGEERRIQACILQLYICSVAEEFRERGAELPPAPALSVAAVIHVIEESVGGEVGWKERKRGRK